MRILVPLKGGWEATGGCPGGGRNAACRLPIRSRSSANSDDAKISPARSTQTGVPWTKSGAETAMFRAARLPTG